MIRLKTLIKHAAPLAACLWFVSAAVHTARADDAQELYKKNCNVCHGPSGKGDGPAGKMLKPPPADFGTVAKGASEADLTKIIKEGGKAVGRSAAMPAFGTKLNDEQIKDLVQLVKGFSSK
jgi:mono/diheme cytochrome c family protein